MEPTTSRNLLSSDILDRRAQVIAGDLEDLQVGVDGYLLWQYTPEDGCGVIDYRPADPAWDVIQAATQ